MEVVNRLPKPADPVALGRLVDAQQILCSRCVSEDDCAQAKQLLEDLAAPESEGGFDYFPALLTLASLHHTGFEPAIPVDEKQAARCYLGVLSHESAAKDLEIELLDDAATQLCGLVKAGTAGLGKEELQRLEKVASGEAAGSQPSVKGWARFAFQDAERQLREASEDPATRERRLQREREREAARKEQKERQKGIAEAALVKAEGLRQQGNDAFRQGHLPGNAAASRELARALQAYGTAIEELSTALKELGPLAEEATEVKRQRGLLCSNAAEVHLKLEDWSSARKSAEGALEDDPQHLKSLHRLARAQMGLKQWEAGAKTVDGALTLIKEQRGADASAMRLELWRLAEEITQQLPGWQWSSAKPEQKAKTPAVDWERRLVGQWKYSGGAFTIAITNWGALIFHEDTIKVDLMPKSKLRWSGEMEMIPGMVLNISYEPGSDVIITEFVPPPDTPMEDQYKGPKSFTAHRVDAPPEPEEPSQEEPPKPEEPAPEPAPQAAVEPEPVEPQESLEEALARVLQGAPEELWVSGQEGFCGRYVLLQEVHNDHPAYRRAKDGAPGGDFYLWFRGGNWGVTSTLSSSPLAAPFQARCPDISGRARHPLELRRPRWVVRRCKGQEEADASVQVQAAADARPAEAKAPAPAEGDAAQAGADPGSAPASVEVSGRAGAHAEVNGLYQRSESLWSGRPVYVHTAVDNLSPLKIFYDHGHWMLARELCTVARAVARCRRDAPHPAALGGSHWEFLQGDARVGHMVTVDTRTYSVDRAVAVRAADPVAADEDTRSPLPALIRGRAPDGAAEGAANKPAPAKTPGAKDFQPPPRPSAASARYPVWVSDASAKLEGSEIRVAIVVSDTVPVDMQGLSLDLASDVLQVGLDGQELLRLPLPEEVDAGANPAAKWSEKTRTLKVKLLLARA